MFNNKIGVLLINLGTPNSYEKKDVRKYLQEFLMDKRVIDIPWLLRVLLLYLIILPFRTKKSAKAYEKIWFKDGSPLFVHSKNLAHKVQACLGENHVVKLAMRYQNPSIHNAIKNLMIQKVSHIIVFPLFPQYASAASGSALEKVYEELKNYWNVVPTTIVPSFYKHELFIDCFVNRIKETLTNFKADYVLFSYHGLPERHILKSGGDENFCYRTQCFATTKAIVDKLNLSSYSNSFQSRLGRTKWIEPYTDLVLPELAKNGVKNLAVVCPAFVADCLETLEEIAIRAQEQWKLLGGEELVLVPSLNAEDDWANSVSTIIKEHTYES